MDKNKDSAVSKFLEGVDDGSFEQPKDPFEQIVVEPKEEVVEKEEKPLPFHKDPKVQKFIEKEISKRLADKVETVERTQTAATEDEFKEVMDSFTTVIGNDTPEKVNALNALKKSLMNIDQKSIRRAEEKIQEIAERESKADDEAEQELEKAFEDIEENFDVDITSSGATKLRQEFVTFVEKIAPKDRNGDVIDYPDMNSAWETFSEIKKATPSRAKELASRSMARSTGTATVQPKKVDWNAVDEFMDSLK